MCKKVQFRTSPKASASKYSFGGLNGGHAINRKLKFKQFITPVA